MPLIRRHMRTYAATYTISNRRHTLHVVMLAFHKMPLSMMFADYLRRRFSICCRCRFMLPCCCFADIDCSLLLLPLHTAAATFAGAFFAFSRFSPIPRFYFHALALLCLHKVTPIFFAAAFMITLIAARWLLDGALICCAAICFLPCCLYAIAAIYMLLFCCLRHSDSGEAAAMLLLIFFLFFSLFTPLRR